MDITRMAARIREAGVALLLAFAVVHPAASQALTTGQTSGQMPEAAKQEILANFGKLPLRFEANRGQSHPEVNFLARGSGYTLYLTGTEAVLVLRQGQANRPDVLRMKLIGASPAPQVAGLEKLPGTAHYFIGNDPKAWRTGIPTYAKVEYRNVYPGVSLVYYGSQGGLEYDFVLAPGADPGVIRVAFEGANSLQVDARGDLVLQTARGEVRQRKPVIYQEVNGARQEVSGGYLLKGRDQIAFHVAAYDASRPLVIDPFLSYSTYLGGSGVSEQGNSIAVDGSGNVYVTGQSDSTDFPAPAGGTSPTFGGGVTDAFVAKLGPSGALLYTAYLGGSLADTGMGIALDSSGNIYVTGRTLSSDFPTLNAFQSVMSGTVGDVFVAKLNATGSALVYSTFLGGADTDDGNAIAVDGFGNAYVTGKTFSAGTSPFPITATPIQGENGGSYDAFVAKIEFNAGVSALVYSTYLGGGGYDEGRAIAVDGSGNAYVTGDTFSANFPPATPLQGAIGGPRDAFVAKINTGGSALVYSTYLGGSGIDVGRGIAVDASGNAYVTGGTNSTDFPVAIPFQSVPGGDFDAFVAKVNAGGSALVYSTYLGGGGAEFGFGIAVDGSGNAYVTGDTFSANFPTATPLQGAIGGPRDAFVAKVNAGGSALVYSTYLGGGGAEFGFGIAVGGSGNAYVTGTTDSPDFPTMSAFQPVFGGAADAFVAKILDQEPAPPAPPEPQVPPTPDPPAVVVVPFATFSLREFDLDNDDDDFEVAFKAHFKLGAKSDGIKLDKDDVTIQVGTASVTIPAGSFRQDRRGRFKYEGVINGVRVKASIRSQDGGSYTFQAKGEEVRRGDHRRRDHRDGEPSLWKRHGRTSAPVTVALTIGDDSGTTTWNGKASHRHTRDREHDRERDD
jgi:hypothetical protein